MAQVFEKQLVEDIANEFHINDLANATIGQVVLVASSLEARTGIPFVRMDQGVPGMQACKIGVEAEKKALDSGVAAIYSPAEGIKPFKDEASRFVKAFLDVDIAPVSCVPTVGSVLGSFASFIACCQLDEKKDKVLFIDPGFPIQKSQLNIMGYGHYQFDIYEFRGEKLKEKLESYLKKGDVSSIIYSNPNNPAWICLTEDELKTVGELATKYDVIVLEDLAYMGMDFRRELGTPFCAPFIPTVAKYTDNYILMLSGSKIFSYAGERIAFTAVSNKLFNTTFESLAKRYKTTGHFGSTFTNAILYMISSGTAHSVQYAMAEMMKASSDGVFNFVEQSREYARRSNKMKEYFLANGFHIVYDKDLDEDISDGFFFSIGHKDFTSAELMLELIYYGISSITLTTTGSLQQGIRACCSRMSEDMFPILKQRLEQFAKDHK